MSIKISVKIQQSPEAIAEEINKLIAKDVNIAIKKSIGQITAEISDVFIKAIEMTEEYSSLLNGELMAEFGLPDAFSRLENIINVWKNNINIKFNSFRGTKSGLSGSFVVSMVLSSFADVLSLPASVLQTEKGENLYWLEWLLLEGDKTIIKEYHSEVADNSSNSRTGSLIMIRGGSWSVPAHLSGTVSDNFVTRAIDNIPDSLIENIIESHISRNI